ncbi:hypothetical protein ABVK25_004860 [Lepraria finkii]|uniref:Uncharacterized protein n=1 Tax=Lepraria finkii TaxID=1340010 RepID=A0ABR4BC84_9LECA
MLGISQHPLLMANETVSGWHASDNWSDNSTNVAIDAEAKKPGRNATEPYNGKEFWAYFTYTVPQYLLCLGQAAEGKGWGRST